MTALLLDRDGVVNAPPAPRYVLDYDRDFVFVPAFESSVRPFVDAGVPLVVVSNQSCVGRGLISLRDARKIMERMVQELARKGIGVTGYALCPHAPEAGCDCRKPKPGLLLECRRRFGVNLAASAFIGDSETDVTAGRAAGCRTFKVDADDEARYRQAFADAFAWIKGAMTP